MHGDPDGMPNASELLYTNFHPQAAHRSTPLGITAGCIHSEDLKPVKSVNLETLTPMNPKHSSLSLRLISGADEFRRIHGSSPMTLVPGFTPYRYSPAIIRVPSFVQEKKYIPNCNFFANLLKESSGIQCIYCTWRHILTFCIRCCWT